MDDTSSEASASTATSYTDAPEYPTSSALTAHHKLLVDAITKGPVNGSTDLAALYDLEDPSIDNVLLKNLTHVSEPAVRCSVVTKDGTVYPPTEEKGEHGYEIFFRFNKLVSVARGYGLH